MYDPPYSVEEIRQQYPEKAEWLLKDPAHLWRATMGIELIHEEPTQEELERIWKNWNEMTDVQKQQSEAKSLELFGMTNQQHYEKLTG